MALLESEVREEGAGVGWASGEGFQEKADWAGEGLGGEGMGRS